MLNFLFIHLRIRDRTFEIKHAGLNLIPMENAFLSLMSLVQGTHSVIPYLRMIEILSEFQIMPFPFF